MPCFIPREILTVEKSVVRTWQRLRKIVCSRESWFGALLMGYWEATSRSKVPWCAQSTLLAACFSVVRGGSGYVKWWTSVSFLAYTWDWKVRARQMRSSTPFTRTSNLLFLPHGTQENISPIGGNKTDDLCATTYRTGVWWSSSS